MLPMEAQVEVLIKQLIRIPMEAQAAGLMVMPTGIPTKAIVLRWVKARMEELMAIQLDQMELPLEAQQEAQQEQRARIQMEP